MITLTAEELKDDDNDVEVVHGLQLWSFNAVSRFPVKTPTIIQDVNNAEN